MRWTSIVAIYSLFWAFSVFLVLPWGVRTGQEVGAEHVPGSAESAPHEFRPGRVALWVTVIATVLFGLYYANYVNGWVTPEMLIFFNVEAAPQVR